ncbi:ATP-binding protein [Alteromonas sp. ASW11-36]|uniref:histidine kinase n=1 Tax=Alteromonas arenosi TaxID=3055817 RepID=A0ABT7SVQ0_9ALTE|nr:ATP-binding protein [Alteromonas sp. ASW11-36]MDM7860251.1 ATP-binding protein [Alteromonas sp. ASW11-36]
MNIRKQVTIDNCDQEPIHIPGAIQPHAFIIILDSKKKICGFSDNFPALIDKPPKHFLGKKLFELTVFSSFDILSSNTSQTEVVINKHKYSVNITELPHNRLCLELESASHNLHHVQSNEPFVQNFIESYEKCSTPQEIFTCIANNIRKYTLYDRCMVYRFDKHWNGEVVAESKLNHLEAFLGLHYPHTDIPAQARKLYSTKLTRLIADVDYIPSVIITHSDILEPIDLTLVDSRSISPMHIKYLQNMGVKATLVMSIMVEEKLWGLIACHHYSGAKILNFNERQLCSSLASITSLYIEKLENLAVSKKQQRAVDFLALDRLLKIIESPDTADAFVSELLRLTESDGAALIIGNNIQKFGNTTSEKLFGKLFELTCPENTWITSENIGHISNDSKLLNRCAGVCVIPITNNTTPQNKDSTAYIILFRNVVTSIVNWAGNPTTKEFTKLNDVETLSPRRSFALWQEKMDTESKEWTEADKKVIHLLSERLKEAYLILVQKRRQHELELISETSDIGLWWLNFKNGSLLWNESMFRIYGINKSNFSGTYDAWRSALLEEDREHTASRFEKNVYEKKPFQASFHIRHPRKGVRLIRAHAKPVLSESGEVLQIVGTNIDITDEVWNLNSDIAQDTTQVEHSRLISLGEMAATVGHEINNPLAIIMNSLELQSHELLESAGTFEVARKHNERARAASERIKKIVAGLKSISRRTAESTTGAICNIDEAVNEIVELMRELYSPKGFTLHYETDQAVAWCAIDKSVLQQVLVNIITNAIHALEDSPYKHVEIKQGIKKNKLTIDIVDKGEGISQSNLEKVFHPFYTTKPRGEGTGLGLTVSKRLLSDNGGELNIRSERGKGTTVSLTIETAQNPKKVIKPTKSPINKAGTCNILIVDDEQEIRELVAMQLETLGFEVQTLSSGQRVIQTLKSNHFDYLMIDSQMPGKSGEDVILEIPAGISTKVILMTGDVTKDNGSLRKRGVHVYRLLYKPFSLKDLSEIFESGQSDQN